MLPRLAEAQAVPTTLCGDRYISRLRRTNRHRKPLGLQSLNMELYRLPHISLRLFRCRVHSRSIYAFSPFVFSPVPCSTGPSCAISKATLRPLSSPAPANALRATSFSAADSHSR